MQALVDTHCSPFSLNIIVTMPHPARIKAFDKSKCPSCQTKIPAFAVAMPTPAAMNDLLYNNTHLLIFPFFFIPSALGWLVLALQPQRLESSFGMTDISICQTL